MRDRITLPFHHSPGGSYLSFPLQVKKRVQTLPGPVNIQQHMPGPEDTDNDNNSRQDRDQVKNMLYGFQGIIIEYQNLMNLVKNLTVVP